MITNKRKQELLTDKGHLYLDQEESYQQIQMTNIQALNKQGYNYTKLEDQGNYNPHTFKQNHSKNNIHPNQSIQNRVFTNQPIYPTTSFNYEPNVIFINGTTFVHKDAIKGIYRDQPKLKRPQMEVQCERCCLLQKVPANTHSFICFDCDLTQGCQPKYGIFICGHCQRKVWYPAGSSDLIKCTKCGTVNHIVRQNNRDEISSFTEKNTNNNLSPEKYFTQRYPI